MADQDEKQPDTTDSKENADAPDTADTPGNTVDSATDTSGDNSGEPTYDDYDPYAGHEDYYHESPFTHVGMPTVTIPPSQLHHGKLAMGSWAFGGDHWGKQSDHHSRAVMEASIRRGMNHFDTADSFGRGRSEMLIARFLEADYHRREGIFLSSQTMLHEPDPQAVLDRLNASLDRLETYWVDLYYVSWPHPTADMRPVFELLESARDEGKIKSIGVNHFSLEQIKQVREVCDLNACQVTYNLLWRHAEKELLPYCHEEGISVVTTSSLAQGILSGKFGEQPRFEAGDIRATTVPFAADCWPRVQAAIEKCKHVAREAGRPLPHLALRWINRNPSVTSITVGARNAIQLNELAGSMVGDVNDDLLNELTVISDELQSAWPSQTNLFQFCP